MKKTIVIIVGFLLVAGIAMSQEIKLQTHTISLNFLQIKEEMNYGLVFRGPGLGYAYSAQWQNEVRMLTYEGRFTFSFPMTRGILAAATNVVPVRLDYLFKVGPGKKITVGPYFIAECNLETYPDLQSIYNFWFTHYSLGGAFKYPLNLEKDLLEFSLHTTLLGLASRQPVYNDPYFNDPSFGNTMKLMHENLTFGSWNLYNQTEFEVKWQPKPESRLAYAYSFNYYGFYTEPRLTMLNHTLKLVILPKKNK